MGVDQRIALRHTIVEALILRNDTGSPFDENPSVLAMLDGLSLMKFGSSHMVSMIQVMPISQFNCEYICI